MIQSASRHWAALGALVAVEAIVLDPFLQAVITTYGSSDNTATERSAIIGYALKVDGGQVTNWYISGPSRLVNTSAGLLLVFSTPKTVSQSRTSES
jgi:hypothetical protein